MCRLAALVGFIPAFFNLGRGIDGRLNGLGDFAGGDAFGMDSGWIHQRVAVLDVQCPSRLSDPPRKGEGLSAQLPLPPENASVGM